MSSSLWLSRDFCGLVLFRVGQICGVQLPDCDGVGVVVYRRESNHIVIDLNDVKSKCSTLSRIYRDLADEFTMHGEFHDFAGLIWIWIDPVAIANQQMPIRREHHCQSPMQVHLIPVD